MGMDQDISKSNTNLKMGVQYAVILVLATIFYQAETACVSDQHINGCSVPIKGNFPYETRFLPACNRHDVCYRCGIVYSWTRKECDRAFLRDMLQICHRYSV